MLNYCGHFHSFSFNAFVMFVLSKEIVLECFFTVKTFWPVLQTLGHKYTSIFRSHHQRCYIKIGVLKNFAKFTGKHCARVSFLIKSCSPQACNFIEKRLWHMCFPVNFEKFLRTPFLQNTSGRMLLYFVFRFFLVSLLYFEKDSCSYITDLKDFFFRLSNRPIPVQS